MRLAPAFALMLATLAMPVAAQQTVFGGVRADITAPVEVAADSLSVDQASGQAVFSGNVVIGQGQMRLAADRVSVHYADADRRRIELLVATGKVTLVSGPDAAEAAQADYDVASGIVVLTGDVILTQGGNVLRGDAMRVDLAQGTAQVDGRVRSILQPGGR